ncbi:MAG: hypothetical protein H6659_12590 [Ardenticatenaceae bacterium]|nr:hypothetical protein [Ardenticatenaceae bacterium]
METTDLTIKRHTAVWTQDQDLLGDAMHIYHRLDNINPALKYYAAYLDVFSFELGEHYYIPLEFVEGMDGANGRLILTITRKKVEDNTWNRMPGFIANGKARKEDLPA